MVTLTSIILKLVLERVLTAIVKRKTKSLKGDGKTKRLKQNCQMLRLTNLNLRRKKVRVKRTRKEKINLSNSNLPSRPKTATNEFS
jgi:hypothetical protein